MKMLVRSLFVLSLSFHACNKETEDTRITNGRYKGSFQREIAGGSKTSNVELLFSNGTWSGGSDSIKYPALCHGIYSIRNKQIDFQDHCFWTAEFDWSLILAGSFEVTVSGDSLTLSRRRNEYVDRYRLVRMR